MLLSHEIDFKAKHIIRNKEGRFMVLKGSVHQEDVFQMGAQCRTASRCRKQDPTERERGDRPLIVLGDFNTPFTELIEQLDK